MMGGQTPRGAMQQRTLMWGGTQQFKFQVGAPGPTSVTLANQPIPQQLARVHRDIPIVWLVEWVVTLTGFVGEANSLSATLLTTVGLGRAMSQIFEGTTLTAPITTSPFTFRDQGQIPATDLQWQGILNGGPFTVPGLHVVEMGLYACPFFSENEMDVGELRHIRRLLQKLAGEEQT